MNYPTLRFVFDRKKTATKTKKSLVQIEVLHRRRRCLIGTGVKVYIDQWSDRYKVVNSPQAGRLNTDLDLQLGNIQKYVNRLIENNLPFEFDAFNAFIRHEGGGESFLDYIDRRIEERHDLSANTLRAHRGMLDQLRECGGIVRFSDLTRANILHFDAYLRARHARQTSVHAYHQRLKRYINEAIRAGLVEANPYAAVAIPRGRCEGHRYLTAAELEKIENCEVKSAAVRRARDLFIFQCYTGLAYSDLARFDFGNVTVSEGRHVIRDTRVKTGGDYVIVLLSPALRILQQYGNKLPIIGNNLYNIYLKRLAALAGVERRLTTHVGRHTFATWALSNGVRIEHVSRMLGHTDIKMTQIYARILAADVQRDFDGLEAAIKNRAY